MIGKIPHIDRQIPLLILFLMKTNGEKVAENALEFTRTTGIQMRRVAPWCQFFGCWGERGGREVWVVFRMLYVTDWETQSAEYPVCLH